MGTINTMNKRSTKAIAILLCVFLSGCLYEFAKYAPPHEDLMSKILKPETDKALIYYFRSESIPGYGQMRMSLSDQHLGNLWDNQYLYFYSYPYTTYSRAENGGTVQYNIHANKTYYFEVFLDSDKKRYWKKIDRRRGIALLNKFKLTGDFNKIIFSPQSPSKPLTPTENNFLKMTNHLNEIAGKDANMTYNNNSKNGVITYKTKIDNRQKIFEIIEGICNTKNIAIKSGSEHNGGSVYTILDEVYKNNKYTIEFKCLY